eukprot:CAMPEP_0115015974 /NCGR_PEP_ID=MMETSP0216-20121206/27121_1 /TAXON_ID=223996 /ORGANISM="Protocruzia adherens, Strain Boccale" /LENGTH=503 /DNA_ID=CAMNT_0002386263 /DNA_START=129 /DNA_END=1640 /DNA_ORIENTATION=-
MTQQREEIEETRHDDQPNEEKISLISSDSPRINLLKFVANFLNQLGFGTFHVHITLILGVINFADGATFAMLCLSSKQFNKAWGIDENNRHYLAIVSLAGTLIGAILATFVAYHKGRRYSLNAFLIVNLAFSVFCCFAPNFWFVILCRFGLDCALSALVALSACMQGELSACEGRGTFILSSFVFYPLGELMVLTIGSLAHEMTEVLDWRICFISTVVPSLIATVSSLIFLPESPRYLALVEHVDALIETLSTIARANGNHAFARRERFAGLKQEDYSMVVSDRVEYWFLPGLLESSYLKVTCILSLLWLVVACGLSLAVWVAIDGGGGEHSFIWLILVIALADLSGALLATLFIESGRVITLGVFCGVSVVFFVLMVTISGYSTLLAALLRAGLYGVSCIGFLIVIELYPTRLRVDALCLLVCLSKFASIGGGFLAPVMLVGGDGITLKVLMGISLLIVLVVTFYLPDVTGGHLIEENFDSVIVTNFFQTSFTSDMEKRKEI